MQMRTTKPENGNKFYNNGNNGGSSWCINGNPKDSGCNVLANCVGYACGRFNEIIGSMKYPELCCNAENFIEKAKSKGLEISDVPTLGGIMVWQKGPTLKSDDGAGHVAIVERIDSKNQIFISESNWGGKAFVTYTLTNNNGRWGMSSGYTFRGCIINPAIGRVVAEEPKKEETGFSKGNYETLGNMYVRTGAGTNHSVKLVKDLTADGKKHATSSNLYAYAVYRKGTVFTALEIIENSRGVWARTPSGYVCIKGASGTVYCKKC